jgi:choloylglycine hydrolase
MISCREESIVVESVEDGLHVYDNPVGVMTNNPMFPIQLWNLENTKVLPGALDSPSRFVRAAHVLKNSVCGASEEESVGQFFHILTSVEQQRGCHITESGEYEITAYSCCCNTNKGIYYYVTYGNRQITAVDMHREDLEAEQVICYDLVKSEQIFRQNSD